LWKAIARRGKLAKGAEVKGTVLDLYSVASTRRLVWAVSTLVLVALLSVSAYVTDGPRAAVGCVGKDVFPSQSLPSVANNTPSGTTFCIRDGTYNISSPVIVQSGDVFWGVYSDSTRPVVTTTTARHIFYAGDANGATIKTLIISGAVGDAQCEPNCGRGIGGGRNLTVDGVRVTNNQNQGIGGTLSGLVVRNSTIDHNGSRKFSRLDGGPSSTSGVKSVNSLTVTNSNVNNNYWNGVWCDEECNTFNVKNSTITDNGKAGVSYEWSTGPAVISGNTIQRNGWNTEVTTRRAGLIIVDSAHADVLSNTFGSNKRYGIEVGDAARSPAVTDVYLSNNTMNGNSIVGCGLVSGQC
jgi:hypothetical protein